MPPTAALGVGLTGVGPGTVGVGRGATGVGDGKTAVGVGGSAMVTTADGVGLTGGAGPFGREVAPGARAQPRAATRSTSASRREVHADAEQNQEDNASFLRHAHEHGDGPELAGYVTMITRDDPSAFTRIRTILINSGLLPADRSPTDRSFPGKFPRSANTATMVVPRREPGGKEWLGPSYS